MSTSADGQIWKGENYWTGVYTAPSGTISNDNASMWIGACRPLVGWGFRIHRGALFFDTSDLPDTANITSVILSIYLVSKPAANYMNITVQGTNTYPSSPLQDTDYNYNKYTDTNYGTFNTTSATASQYWNLTLNANGRGNVSLSGTTRFMLRSNDDVNNNSTIQVGDYNMICIDTNEAGESYVAKLYVTYPYDDGIGVYNYDFIGPYKEDGSLYNGTVTVRFTPTGAVASTFTLTSNGTAAQTVHKGVDQQAISSSWNISNVGNYTRVHYFTSALTETIYVFVPDPNTPYYLYSFTVNSFANITNPYLESLIFVGGVNRVVERQKADAINQIIPFFLQWGNVYSLRFVCDEGTLNLGAFTALADTNPTVIVPLTAFDTPISTADISASATRVNSTHILVSYSNALADTQYVNVTINKLSGSGALIQLYADSSTSNTYSLNWYDGYPDISYYVQVSAVCDLKNYTWTFDLPKNTFTRNIWQPLNNLGSGLPIELQYIPALVIVVCAFLAFSYWHLSAGAWVAWAVTGFFIYIGWLPNIGVYTIAPFAFAGFACALLSIGEWKETARGVS